MVYPRGRPRTRTVDGDARAGRETAGAVREPNAVPARECRQQSEDNTGVRNIPLGIEERCGLPAAMIDASG